MNKKNIPVASPFIGQEEAEAVYEVVKSGWISMGKKVEEFEEGFCEYVKSRYAIAVNNGTAALHLAGLALGWGEDDVVITTPITFLATTNSIVYCGNNKEDIKSIEQLSVENLKRVKIYKRKNWDDQKSQSPYFIEKLQELKTIWHPTEV